MSIAPVEYLSREEGAVRLGVRPDTLSRWIRAGIIPAVRLPGRRGRYRIHPDDLRLALQQVERLPVSRTGAL